MSTTAINSSVQAAVEMMLKQHALETVQALANKYNFDVEEDVSHLELGGSTDRAMSPSPVARRAPLAKSGKKGAASKVPKEEKEKKPRKPSGYQAFSKAMREETKGELAGMSMSQLQAELELDDEPDKFHPKHVMTALGKRWKALDEEERTEWNERASSAGSEDGAEE